MTITYMDAEEIARYCGNGKERRSTIDRRDGTQRWMTCCPAHADKTPSMCVHDGHKWVIFKCESGCDSRSILDALYREGVKPKRFDGRPSGRPTDVGGAAAKRREPAKKAADEEWIGRGLAKPPARNEVPVPRGYHLYKRWPWHNEAGEVIMYTFRADADDGSSSKHFIPMSAWRIDGQVRWANRSVPPKRPLYDLHLSGYEGDILCVEGEKKVEAAKMLFKGCGGISWITTAGAAQSFRSADLSPFLGRRVIFATDMDGPGLAAASIVAASPASRVDLLRLPPSLFPEVTEGYDIADLCQSQHWRDEGLMKTVTANLDAMLINLR